MPCRINSLESLVDVLNNPIPGEDVVPDPRTGPGQPHQDEEDAYADALVAYWRGLDLPVAHGEIDMTSLPTFGGEEPADTTGVWSWDATRLLVGDAAPFRLAPRSDL